jgi:hypothetical protein
MKVFLRQNINPVTIWNPFRRTLKFKPVEQNSKSSRIIKKMKKKQKIEKKNLKQGKRIEWRGLPGSQPNCQPAQSPYRFGI